MESEEKFDCPPVPNTFQSGDLVGAWIAEYGLGDTDEIVLRSDGTYRQTFKAAISGYRYESDWNEFWIEPRPSGYLRLHMLQMRRCDSLEELCSRKEGGIGPNDWAIDECENEIVEMVDEVILIVTGSQGAEASVSDGILLRHARLAGSEAIYGFRPREQE